MFFKKKEATDKKSKSFTPTRPKVSEVPVTVDPYEFTTSSRRSPHDVQVMGAKKHRSFFTDNDVDASVSGDASVVCVRFGLDHAAMEDKRMEIIEFLAQPENVKSAALSERFNSEGLSWGLGEGKAFMTADNLIVKDCVPSVRDDTAVLNSVQFIVNILSDRRIGVNEIEGVEFYPAGVSRSERIFIAPGGSLSRDFFLDSAEDKDDKA